MTTKRKTQSEPHPNSAPASFSKARTTRRYQQLVVGFTLLSIAVIAIIVYLSFSKTVITVVPAEVEHTASFTVRAQEQLPEEAGTYPIILAKLVETTVQDSLSYTNITSSGQINDIARGTVTIFNNWSQDQPLIATTRLLTSDNIMFRIEDSVTVPAGGKIENVAVYADKEGPTGNVNPTTFTIPGLWEGLRERIYAENPEPITGGVREAKTVAAEDIQEAKTALHEQMALKARAALDTKASEAEHAADLTNVTVIVQQLLTEKISAEIGDEENQFTVEQSMRFIGIAYSPDAISQVAKNHLQQEIGEEMKFISLTEEDIAFSSSTYNLDEGYADLRVTASGISAIRLSSSIFDRSKLLAKDTQEIKAYFAGFDEIESVQIRFSPFWLKKTPSLKDHIEIKFAGEAI